MNKIFKFRKNLLIIILICNYTSFAQPSKQQLYTLDTTLITLHHQSMFNGVVLVAQKGKPVYQKAFGFADFQKNEPLSTSSSFNLASISKQFFAMMIMQLKEQNKLNYDDKVTKFIPSLPYPNITIRHLLTHTSGLPEYEILTQKYYNTLDTLTNEKLISLLAERKPPLNFEPNSKWEYSNTGYVLLASIIEKASGVTIEDFFQKNITHPLGLKNTFIFSFNSTNPEIKKKQRVLGFERRNGKYFLNDLIRLDGVVGDGNIYSSAEDLLVWEQALYSNKLVSQITLSEAFQPVKLIDNSTFNYGFGWFLSLNKQAQFHTGSWVGFRNFIERDTKTNTTIIVLSNSTNSYVRDRIKSIISDAKFKLPQFKLIQNVKLIDGTGSASRNESVRLKDEKIWEIGDLTPFEKEIVIDGNGLVLAPGFIDSHSHHFGGLDKTPEAIPTASQGITTIIIGQDGGSYSMDSLQKFFNQRKVAVNIGSYTGHSTLRSKVMGAKSLYRTAKTNEIEQMKALLINELGKGSFGLNTGLEYESAFFSNREEVLELAKVAASKGGRYMSHIRSEDINLAEAIDEIIEIGRQTKMPVQIAHIKIAKKDNWKTSPQLIAQLQKARAEGINITADCYPYNFWNSTLRVLFPNRDYTNPVSAEFAVNQLFDPEKSVLVRFAPNKTYAGKTISEIAQIRNEKPSQTLMNLIAIAADFEEKNPDFDEGIEAIMGKSMDDFDVNNLLLWQHTNICSDGSSSGHPRGHGTFTRVLGRYVREQKLMPLETAIYKMTGLTAEHLGITDRGTIAVGNYADLVLFNPETVIDNANIQNGKALSSGIEKVWVNGEIVYLNQKPTGKLTGKLLKRQ